MKPALHRDHRPARERAAQEAARVRLDGRQREPGDVAVPDARLDIDSLGERTEAGAEDDSRVGLSSEPRAYHVGRTLDALERVRTIDDRSSAAHQRFDDPHDRVTPSRGSPATPASG